LRRSTWQDRKSPNSPVGANRHQFGHLRIGHLAKTAWRKDHSALLARDLACQKPLLLQTLEEGKQQRVGTIKLLDLPACLHELDVFRFLAGPLLHGVHSSSTPTSCVWNRPPMAETTARGAF